MNDDPLSQLLSEHQNETTILDKHFENKIAQNAEKNNATLLHNNDSINKPKKNENNGDDDDNQPIGLTHRQPSYTSLHGNLIGKDGVKVDRLPDLKEEGEETNIYHQNFDSSESKPTKPSKKSKESKNKIISYSSQDNVIAFDEHDDSEDVPIGLTYRQPSFSSMGDHLISKGGDSLSDIVPLKTIPIEEAIIEEEIDKEIKRDGEEDEEDDEDPQVQIVKDLKQKNKDRWLKMGYEPPPNLIQLTRAQSQSVFNQNQVFMQNPPTISPLLFSPVLEEEENPKSNNHHEQTSTNKPKIAHRRCGSNGMKLGEASSSLARMSQALMIFDSNSKIQDKDSDKEYENEEEEAAENEFGEEEEAFSNNDNNNNSEKEENNKKDKQDKKKEKDKEHKIRDKKYKNKDKKNKSKSKKQSEEKNDSDSSSYSIIDLDEKRKSYLFPSSSSSYDSDSESENDFYYYHHGNDELFGKLGQIVKEDQSSEVYKAILTGKLPKSSDNHKIKQRIQQYINTCINNLWVDETEYLTKIIDSSSKRRRPHHQTKSDNYRFIPRHQHHFSHKHHYHRKIKSTSPIERLKIKASEEDSIYKSRIQEILLKQQHMLDMLNEEYKEAVNDLDAKYIIESSSNRDSKSEYRSNWYPSPAVCELRATIKRLLKAKKYSAVQELSSKLKKLEMEEESEISEMIHDHYVNADRLLKEHFAMRRSLLLSKIQYELQAISEERQSTARRYSKNIARLKSLNFRENYGLLDDEYSDDDDDDYSDNFHQGTFPQRINYGNLEKILELMSEEDDMMSSSSSSSDSEEYDEKPKKRKKDKREDKRKKDKKKNKKEKYD